uniref:Uncharacterized protein n=1 Tax=Gopherus agassizii TaxID=38772 RepID=A0A452I5Y1_9SAUR
PRDMANVKPDALCTVGTEPGLRAVKLYHLCVSSILGPARGQSSLQHNLEQPQDFLYPTSKSPAPHCTKRDSKSPLSHQGFPFCGANSTMHRSWSFMAPLHRLLFTFCINSDNAKITLCCPFHGKISKCFMDGESEAKNGN